MELALIICCTDVAVPPCRTACQVTDLDVDAVRAGLTTRVLVDLTAAVGAESAAEALGEMRAAGVALIGGP